MIDLHTHTNQSDGTLAPAELVTTAATIGLDALAITDHDTLSGYDQALPCARECGLDLICGIELSAAYRGRSTHVLGYFLKGLPSAEFREWVLELQRTRLQRNQHLAEKLQTEGFDITLDEVAARGSNLIGRPHFAACMMKKGYVASIQEAFDKYLAENGSCYVPRNEPTFAEATAQILKTGGIPILAHPYRVLGGVGPVECYVHEMRSMGLKGIEAFHSQQPVDVTNFYKRLAKRFSLALSGGSDFHGETKSDIKLGTGINRNLNVSRTILDNLRSLNPAEPLLTPFELHV